MPMILTKLGARCEMSPLNAIERESAKMGLVVNEGKTKFMLSTSGVVPRRESQFNV